MFCIFCVLPDSKERAQKWGSLPRAYTHKDVNSNCWFPISGGWIRAKVFSGIALLPYNGENFPACILCVKIDRAVHIKRGMSSRLIDKVNGWRYSCISVCLTNSITRFRCNRQVQQHLLTKRFHGDIFADAFGIVFDIRLALEICDNFANDSYMSDSFSSHPASHFTTRLLITDSGTELSTLSS